MECQKDGLHEKRGREHRKAWSVSMWSRLLKRGGAAADTGHHIPTWLREEGYWLILHPSSKRLHQHAGKHHTVHTSDMKNWPCLANHGYNGCRARSRGLKEYVERHDMVPSPILTAEYLFTLTLQPSQLSQMWL